MQNKYIKMVNAFEKVFSDSKKIELGNESPLSVPTHTDDSHKMLIFGPHPDDECIIGALPLRLRKENVNVKNVAVTLGSNVSERARRLGELKDACAYLNWPLILCGDEGLDSVNIDCLMENRELWEANVDVIYDILKRERPDSITIPNVEDANSTHVGVHMLVIDALEKMDKDFECNVVETEFWGANRSPNLMVQSSNEEVSQLITALSFHKGEVARNPYHLTLCPWMMDNVRRGGELVGGQGGAVPDFTYATLYRCLKFKDGELSNLYDDGKFVSSTDNLDFLF
ncbi:MAG: PIG-L family deacetylase [Kiritimatiellae bacterium]|nr:PIG-L family deacetylase [Kiritimatiellia bacterium]